MQAMEQQSARHLAEAQQIQIKGTKGERREALRQKHRHQRAALANQVRPLTSSYFCPSFSVSGIECRSRSLCSERQSLDRL